MSRGVYRSRATLSTTADEPVLGRRGEVSAAIPSATLQSKLMVWLSGHGPLWPSGISGHTEPRLWGYSGFTSAGSALHKGQLGVPPSFM